MRRVQAIIYHGSANSRRLSREMEFYFEDEKTGDQIDHVSNSARGRREEFLQCRRKDWALRILIPVRICALIR